MSSRPEWKRVAAEVRAAGTRRGRERFGVCVVEGTRLLERALRAGARVGEVLRVPGFSDAGPREAELLEQLVSGGSAVHEIPPGAWRELTDGRDLGGILGLAERPEAPLPEALFGGTPSLFLVCLGVHDPGNLGALARTAHAAGASAILLAGEGDAFHPRAIRTSKGSLFRLPVAHFASARELWMTLEAARVHTLGAVTDGGDALPELGLPESRSMALVLGSEGRGLGADDLEHLHQRVVIPMAPGVDSYSVNAAAAILLYSLRAGTR